MAWMTRPFSFVASVLTAASLLSTSQASAQARRYISPRSADDASASPFSGAVEVGNTLYFSGTMGLVGGRIPDTPEEEARNLLDRIRERLRDAGYTMDDIVQVQVFCSDVEAYYDAFNSVYRTYFTREFPARAFLGSGMLLNGGRFEVIGIAVKR